MYTNMYTYIYIYIYKPESGAVKRHSHPRTTNCTCACVCVCLSVCLCACACACACVLLLHAQTLLDTKAYWAPNSAHRRIECHGTTLLPKLLHKNTPVLDHDERGAIHRRL